MTKFVGKFRKQKDYNDDYEFSRNALNNRKRKGDHGEVKKLLKMYEEEEHLYGSSYDAKSKKRSH